MSGGHFDHQQYQIELIADAIENFIVECGSEFRAETIDKFKEAIYLLRRSYIFAQRIDWLISGDDGEDSFHRRLKEDLEELYDLCK